jgi:hypothetical protein
LKVGREKEDMDELKSANGHHPVLGSTGIKKVMITQRSGAGNSYDVVDSLEVWGDLGTSITVEVDEVSTNVVITTSGDLGEESASGFGHRYAAKDNTITKVFINDTDTGFDPNLGRARIEIEV